MPPSTPQSQRFAFDRFELDLRSGELLKDGRRLRLQGTAFPVAGVIAGASRRSGYSGRDLP